MTIDTAKDASGFGGLLTTDWRGHGKSNLVHRARVKGYEALSGIARAFTMVAHLANPNQGAATLKDAGHRRGSRT